MKIQMKFLNQNYLNHENKVNFLQILQKNHHI